MPHTHPSSSNYITSPCPTPSFQSTPFLIPLPENSFPSPLQPSFSKSFFPPLPTYIYTLTPHLSLIHKINHSHPLLLHLPLEIYFPCSLPSNILFSSTSFIIIIIIIIISPSFISSHPISNSQLSSSPLTSPHSHYSPLSNSSPPPSFSQTLH